MALRIRVGDVVRLQEDGGPPLYLHCVDRDREHGLIYRVLRDRSPAPVTLDEVVSSPTWFLASAAADIAVSNGYGAVMGSVPVTERPPYRVRGEDGRWYRRHEGQDTFIGKRLTPDVLAVPAVNMATPLALIDRTADPAYDFEQSLARDRERDRSGPSILRLLLGRSGKRVRRDATQLILERVYLDVPVEAQHPVIELAERLGYAVESSPDSGESDLTLVRTIAPGVVLSDARAELEAAVNRSGAVITAVEHAVTERG